MNPRTFVFWLFSVFVLSGCVQSLNPFYTNDAKVTVPELNGKWILLDDQGHPKQQRDWVIEDDRILTYSEKGGSGILDATWFKIGSQLYVDTTAHSPEAEVISDWWTYHVMPVHILCKVERVNHRLVFKPLSLEWMKKALTNEVISLPAVMGDDDMALFNVKPEQWMQFLKKLGTNNDAFRGENEYILSQSPERSRLQEP